MLRQQGLAINGSTTTASGGNGSGSPRVRMLMPGAEPGIYLSPRARAALVRQEREAAAAAEGEAGGGDAASVSLVSPLRLPRSLPEAYHSIAVPRARPGE